MALSITQTRYLSNIRRRFYGDNEDGMWINSAEKKQTSRISPVCMCIFPFHPIFTVFVSLNLSMLDAISAQVDFISRCDNSRGGFLSMRCESFGLSDQIIVSIQRIEKPKELMIINKPSDKNPTILIYLIKNKQSVDNILKKSHTNTFRSPEKLGAFNQFVRINILDVHFFLVKLFGIFSSVDLKSLSKYREKNSYL